MRLPVRLSRPCYDKFHRCPGRAGGGMKYAKVVRCDGGLLDPELYDRRGWKWRLHQCSTCKLIVLPYVIRYVDPGWWGYAVRDARRELAYRVGRGVLRLRHWAIDRLDPRKPDHARTAMPTFPTPAGSVTTANDPGDQLPIPLADALTATREMRGRAAAAHVRVLMTGVTRLVRETYPTAVDLVLRPSDTVDYEMDDPEGHGPSGSLLEIAQIRAAGGVVLWSTDAVEIDAVEIDGDLRDGFEDGPDGLEPEEVAEAVDTMLIEAEVDAYSPALGSLRWRPLAPVGDFHDGRPLVVAPLVEEPDSGAAATLADPATLTGPYAGQPLPGRLVLVKDVTRLVVASVVYSEEPVQVWLVLLLNPSAPYFTIAHITDQGTEVAELSTHDNIVPAVESYAQHGGDY